jgi:Flp pilus assembly protein TadB
MPDNLENVTREFSERSDQFRGRMAALQKAEYRWLSAKTIVDRVAFLVFVLAVAACWSILTVHGLLAIVGVVLALRWVVRTGMGHLLVRKELARIDAEYGKVDKTKTNGNGHWPE